MAYGVLGTITLTKYGVIPYNIGMKHTKAIFLIVLGCFIMATGFAFAVESNLYNSVRNGDPFADGRSASVTPTVATSSGQPAPAAAAPAPAPAPDTPKKPTFGETAKKFLKDNMGTMVAVGAGAYLGMALLGGVMGAMTGGLFFFALMYLGSL